MTSTETPPSLENQEHTSSGKSDEVHPDGVGANMCTHLRSPRAPETINSRKAIYVVGPSSSGKTTLCDAFAADAGIPPSIYIKEIARKVMEKQGFTRADVGTFEMQLAIMTAQLHAEENILKKRATSLNTDDLPLLLLSDRSAVDPLVYAGASNPIRAGDIQLKLRQNTEFESALPFYRKSLFIMLTPVREWVKDDGVRSLEDPWKYCEVLREMLRELAIPFREIGTEMKDIRARVDLMRQWSDLSKRETKP